MKVVASRNCVLVLEPLDNLVVTCLKFHKEFGIKLILAEQIYVFALIALSEEPVPHHGAHKEPRS